MRGAKPIPTEIKRLNGNPGKRKLPTDEPQFPKEAPEPPAFLDEEARKEWDRLMPLLSDCGINSPAYLASLAAYCMAWSRFVFATAKIAETGGEVVKSPSGFPIQNPYSAVRNAAEKTIIKIAAEFGLTASSKSRIRTTKDGSPGSKLKLFSSRRA